MQRVPDMPVVMHVIQGKKTGPLAGSSKAAAVFFARLVMVSALPAWALPVSAEFLISPDNEVNVDGLVVEDDQLYWRDAMNAFTPVPLPANVELSGYDSDGTATYFSVDITSVIEGVTVEPRDVARWDGFTVSIELDGDAAGIPNGVRVDAVALSPSDSLFISVDTSVNVAGMDVDDEDLFSLSPPTLLFDGEKNEIDPSLDLNAAFFGTPEILVFSFDGAGSVGGIEFNDEDLVAFVIPLGLYELGNTSSGSPSLEAIDVTAVPEAGFSVMLAGAVLFMAGKEALRRRHGAGK